MWVSTNSLLLLHTEYKGGKGTEKGEESYVWKCVTIYTCTLDYLIIVRTVLQLKFIYSEKATKFCKIFPLLMTVCTVVKSKGKILQNFVAFSEYMNFN